MRAPTRATVISVVSAMPAALLGRGRGAGLGRLVSWMSPWLLSALVTCTDANTATATPQGLPAASTPLVTFATDQGEITVRVEVADEPEELRRGLMFRREMAPGYGMLFVFPREEIQSFWMKNTYIALDLIFVSGDHTVVGVVENAEPLTLHSRTVDAPSRYVVEVNAGFAGEHGIKSGTRVVITPAITP